jgi:RNA polymerase sigma-70 factor (ECF subfamily)
MSSGACVDRTLKPLHRPGLAHGCFGKEQMETARCINDCSLIREAQGGNHTAFTQLVHAYDDAVLKLALRLTGSPNDAQDIHQEVFLKVYRKLDCFRFECSFSTWIFRIATNTCFDHLRKHGQRKEKDTTRVNFEGEEYDLLMEVADDRPAFNPEKELIRSELGKDILCALRRLTPRERKVFDLKHFHGLKMRAIGETLNIPEGSVKTCLFRATRKLRSYLAKYTTLQMELPC